MKKASTAAMADVAGKLIHSPFSPREPSAASRITGNTSAVDTERMEAGSAFSTASI